MKSIDPSLTDEEINIIFKEIDKGSKGSISTKDFLSLLKLSASGDVAEVVFALDLTKFSKYEDIFKEINK